MRELFAVGIGGFVGAVARYLVTGWVHRFAGVTFPWGTLTVNAVGCVALGALMGLVEARVAVSPELRLFLALGVLGSFTTFSSVGYETVELMRGGELSLAAANALGSLLLGLLAVVAGAAAARWIAG
jgi:CrcB protein